MSTFVSQFKARATEKDGDLRQRQFIRTALRGYEVARDKRKGAFQSWESARQVAAVTKWEAVNHLDTHLEALVAKLEAREMLSARDQVMVVHGDGEMKKLLGKLMDCGVQVVEAAVIPRAVARARADRQRRPAPARFAARLGRPARTGHDVVGIRHACRAPAPGRAAGGHSAGCVCCGRHPLPRRFGGGQRHGRKYC